MAEGLRADLSVDLEPVRAAAHEVVAAARACGPVAPVLSGVADAVPGGRLAAEAEALAGWARDLDALPSRAEVGAAAAVAGCEALVAVDDGLSR